MISPSETETSKQLLLQLIEDPYDKKWPNFKKNIQWLLSVGQKRTILTNLKYSLPIIITLLKSVFQSMQNTKQELAYAISDLQRTQFLYNQGYKESTEDLEIQVQHLCETLREHKIKDEINS